MRKWSEFVTSKPKLVIFLITLFTLFFVYEMKNLRFENRFTEWFPKSNPVLRTFLNIGEKFGTNELVMVAIKAKKGDTFSPQILRRIKALTDDLKDKEEVFLVTSISNSPDIRKVEGGIEVKDLIEEIPEGEELKKLKAYILSKETFVNNVISKDGKWMAMAIYLKTTEQTDPIKAFSQVIKPTVEKHLSDVADIYYSGDPSDAYFANEFSTKDLEELVPIVIFLIIVVLLFSFRSAGGVIHPLLVVLISTIWTFGTMGLVGKPMDILTPVLPVLLIALGSAYGIHVLNKIYHEDSVQRATYEIFVPVLMAGLTTIVGFLSFATAKLSLIINLGLFSALGIFYSMVIALSLIPAISSLSREKVDLRKEKMGFSVILKPLARAVLSSRWKVVMVFLVILVFFVLWIPAIHREVNFTEYYPKDSIPRKALEVVKGHFGGAYPMELYVKADSVKSPEVLRVMRMGEYYLYSMDKVSLPFSVVDFIEEMNYQLNGRYHIPSTRGEVANLWFFMEGRGELHQIVTPDLKEALIFAKLPEASTSLMRETEKKLDKFLKSYARGFEAYYLDKLDVKKRKLVQAKEREQIEREIIYLGKRYGVNVGRGVVSQLGEVPGIDDPQVLAKVKESLREYILSDSFDFEIPPARAKKLLSALGKYIEGGKSNKKDMVLILKKFVPTDQWDEDTAQDVADTVIYRIREASQGVFVERAWKTLNLKTDNPYFKKKVKGLLWELSDNLAVLPYGTVPFRGKPVKIEKFDQSGFPAAMSELDRLLYVSQLQSLIIALILTFILMAILRKSLGLGLIATTPILFTLGVIYGFLGLSGIPLTYATMMIAGVSIGVGIDYAIHFIHGVYMEVEEGHGLRRAIEQTYIEKGKAILSNSIAVILGFGALLFSRLKPLHQFGGTMMGSMALAALAALTFLPALLLILHRKEVKDEEN